MGLRAGVRLSVQQRLAGGGRVVNVGGARVALGQAVVNGLLVREITQ
jgi:Fe2+ transport system protein FeoA